jgi:cytochrome c peroxidase
MADPADMWCRAVSRLRRLARGRWLAVIVLAAVLLIAKTTLTAHLHPGPAGPAEPREPIVPVPVSRTVDPKRVALGERLFHDARLSRDQGRSCVTCHLVSSIKRAIETRALRAELLSLKDRLLTDIPHQVEAFAEIITQSPSMWAAFRYVEAIAGSPQPVLITGETGTGKELIARALHRLSERPGRAGGCQRGRPR